MTKWIFIVCLVLFLGCSNQEVSEKVKINCTMEVKWLPEHYEDWKIVCRDYPYVAGEIIYADVDYALHRVIKLSGGCIYPDAGIINDFCGAIDKLKEYEQMD